MREKLFDILSENGSLELETVVIRLTAALLIACFIYLSYWISHMGNIYSKKFNVTLVGLTLIVDTVMIVIGSNLALSLGMVGALSIVRYRTAVKDSRDTLYIFWSIVAGICCGAGDYQVAALGSMFIFAVLLLFGRIRNTNRVLLIIRAARTNESRLEAMIFQRYARKATMRVKNTTENSVEFIYELSKSVMDRDRNNSRSITDEIYALGNVEYVNIVSQSDDIGS